MAVVQHPGHISEQHMKNVGVCVRVVDMCSGDKFKILTFSGGGLRCRKDSGSFRSQKLGV